MAGFTAAHLVPESILTLRKGYSLEKLGQDVLAGITVGIVALPLAMAFAIASGVTPDRGIFTAIVAGVFISLFGGSRYQIGGPTGAFVVILFNIIQKHGYDGLVVCVLMAGVLLILMGFCRLGTLIKYIPYPVTTGFTAGIAVLIFSGQVKDFLGMQGADLPPDFLGKWSYYLGHLDQIDFGTLGVSAIALAVIILVRRFIPRIPAPIVGVVAASCLALLLGAGAETIGDRFGGIPDHMPALSFPDVSLAQMRLLFPDALAIALLAGIESLLSCAVADGMTGEQHNSDMELVAQGVANLGAVAFGGIAATGAIARTATNIKAGAYSPVAGIVHSLTLLCFILLLSDMASYIALGSLAAVLMVVAWDMSEVQKFIRLMHAPKTDIFVLLLTFAVTVMVDLTTAVLTGVVLAAMLFMRRMSEATEVLPVRSEKGENFYSGEYMGKEIQSYEIDGPFFFGVASRFRSTMNAMQQQPKVYILRMDHVPFVDSTGMFALETFISQCRRGGSIVLISGVRENVLERMRNLGVLDSVGAGNVFAEYEDSLRYAFELVWEG
ncbi:SulP family inorganic anion transporter [Pseudodesulfovibrio tunisiensis]|uniref:SulP family inorganic anion transporter n=1 Tax=Pseudodesulfovibrio tunisiensis TaxID=463192 RepID=UPI001FB2F1CB|nr:SulP family inorganic anion transporter [Pseudodesulfovibrio tunisiensis]